MPRVGLETGQKRDVPMKYRTNNKGFTLVEILVVVALTIVILGLVFVPLIKTFEFTRRAGIMVKAQDNARLALQQVSRDLANAMYVFDNTRVPIYFPVKNRQTGEVVPVPVYYAKVDLVLPRMRGYCKSTDHPVGVSREYSRHKSNSLLDEASPTCPADGSRLELRPTQPLAADILIVRYFIGLRDPSTPYANGFSERLTDARDDNMYVLYRAEFSPYDARLFDQSRTVAENLAYENFFYDPIYSVEWQRISRPVVTLYNTDLVLVNYDDAGNPVITPTVKFAPTAVRNDPMVPTTEADDDPEHRDAPPTVYKASYGHWVLPYEVILFRQAGGSTVVYTAKMSPGGDYMGVFDSGDNLVFNITRYQQTRDASPYGAGVISGPGEPKPEVAFTVDPVKATASFAFPVVDPALSGWMAVSIRASTDDINQAYEAGAFRDRYRRVLVNVPNSQVLSGATVVPGSEKVVAPDGTPGSSYGRSLEYSRAPLYLYEAGLNQYQLDLDYPVVDANGSSVPNMAGTAALLFHSYQTNQPGSGIPLPPGEDNVLAFYEVQNNKKGDRLRANYVTKSLMTVIMGIRMYDPSSGKPQTVQLTNKVRLRNIAR